jgi:hypothetical protein
MARKDATETVATVAEDKVLITAHVDKATIAKIEEYRWTNRCEGKAEAIRQLILKGCPELRRRAVPSMPRPGARKSRAHKAGEHKTMRGGLAA